MTAVNHVVLDVIIAFQQQHAIHAFQIHIIWKLIAVVYVQLA